MSCLFNSMHVLLSKHGILIKDSQILRRKITKFMKSNPDYDLSSGKLKDWVKMVAEDQGKTSNNYISHMTSSSTWGGGMELAVMSKMFSIKIEIITSSSQKPVAVFECSNNPDATFVLHWTGTHYSPVEIRK